MSKKSTKNVRIKPLSVAIGAAFVTSLAIAPMASASDNPFGMQSLHSGYMVAGGDKAKEEGSCGGDKAKEEGKCGEGKCGEGKCGGDDMGAHVHAAGVEGKCGEGKCGEGKCGSDDIGAHVHSQGGDKEDAEGSCGGRA